MAQRNNNKQVLWYGRCILKNAPKKNDLKNLKKKYGICEIFFFPSPLQSKMGGLRAMWASSPWLLWAGEGELCSVSVMSPDCPGKHLFLQN